MPSASGRAARSAEGGGRRDFHGAHGLLDRSPHRVYLDFVAHGVGLITHETPRLTSSWREPVYEGYDADRPLELDMVISVETAMAHPKRGFIKLEETIAVTEEGCEGFGDTGRGWNQARRQFQFDYGGRP